MLKESHRNGSSRVMIGSIVKDKHEHCPTTKGLNSVLQRADLNIRTGILDDSTAAKQAAQRGVREKQAEIRAVV
jgi:hypothetical protein